MNFYVPHTVEEGKPQYRKELSIANPTIDSAKVLPAPSYDE